MKRIICLLLAVLMTISGCARSLQEETESADRLIVTYQTMPYSRLDGLGRIQKAINEIAKKTIGAEVEFLTVDAQDSFTIYPLWLSQGKRIDLMVLNYQDIQNYVKSGQLLAMDSLLNQHGGDIRRIMDAGLDLTTGTTVNGEIYGLAVASYPNGSGGGLWIPERYLEEAGVAFEKGKIYSMDELDHLFAVLKEKYPDKYPLGQLASGGTFSTYHYFYGMQNPFGDGGVSGCLDLDTGEIVNFYDTDSYREFLHRIRRWYQLGYIYPDAAYTAFSNVELLKSGEILSIPFTSTPGMFEDECGEESLVCLRLSEIVMTGGGPRGIFWVIPATCRNPEEAMEFLNLMYADDRIVNLLVWGEEGLDYKFLDEAEGIITYPENVTQENADYFNPLGLYGDMRLAYALNSNELKNEMAHYVEQASFIYQDYDGFSFDKSPVATEAWQVQEVLDRYLPVLESGCLELEDTYAGFLSALEQAGINIIIAEKQRQLDAWMINQN